MESKALKTHINTDRRYRHISFSIAKESSEVYMGLNSIASTFVSNRKVLETIHHSTCNTCNTNVVVSSFYHFIGKELNLVVVTL